MTDLGERLRDELSGRYRIEGEIGRGATATVYLAHDLAQDRPVAVKILRPELVQALGGQRFLREIRFAAGLNHPHLLAIHDSGESDGIFYYVTPYLADGSLRARLTRERQLPVEEAVRITREVGDALSHIHAQGIIHRDVKPENILFTGAHACVADFGIARAIERAAGDTLDTTLTSTGLVVGTPAYMSPEQASGERVVDSRSDQYSLACVLYEMLAGVPPFIGPTAQSVIAQRFAHAPPPLSFYRPSIPAHIDAAVVRALSVAPADRFASVEQFVSALEQPATGLAAATTMERAHRIRRRWFAIGAATAIAVVVALGFRAAYPRVQAAFGPALDTTLHAIVPMANAADARWSGIDAASAIHAALRRWDGLPLIDQAAVREAVAERPVNSLSAALRAARRLRAGRLVWGEMTRRGSQDVVHLRLYDVARGVSLNDTALALTAGEPVEPAFAAAGRALLRYPGAPAAAVAAADGTRSFVAWRAYMSGHVALASWDLARAEREFVAAVSADPAYRAAQVWRAQLGSWLHAEEPSLWRDAVASFESSRGILSEGDSLSGSALSAIVRRDFPLACAIYDRMRQRERGNVLAWYGSGECRHRDSLVTPDPTSPSGWAFRSSFRAAAAAYLRVVEIEPRAFALPLLIRLREVLPTQARETRAGFSADQRLSFIAFPELVAETLAFVPYVAADMRRGRVRPNTARMNAALERHREILLDASRRWVARYPESAEAYAALADIRERRFEVFDVMGGAPSALEAVRRARALADTPLGALFAAAREVRLLIKRGELDRARALADSLLAETPRPSSDAASALVGLAAVTGRAAQTARLYVAANPERTVEGIKIPQPLVAAAAELQAYAALGVCRGVESRFARVRSMVESYANERQPVVFGALAWRPAVDAAQCVAARAPLLVPENNEPLLRAHRAFATGDLRVARAILDSLAQRARGVRPGEVSLDYTYQLAWLRAALGDTARAIDLLDLSLSALPTQRISLTLNVREAAALPRAMFLRAALALATGDATAARRWAANAAALWRSADADVRSELDVLQARLRNTN